MRVILKDGEIKATCFIKFASQKTVDDLWLVFSGAFRFCFEMTKSVITGAALQNASTRLPIMAETK